MTIEQVVVGKQVLYTPEGKNPPQYGRITKKNNKVAFIKCEGQRNSIAVDPKHISYLDN